MSAERRPRNPRREPVGIGAAIRLLFAQQSGGSWPVDAVDLVAVCALRDATDALLRARLERALAPDSMVRRFNRALAAPSAQTRLEWTAAGPRKSLPAASAQRDTLIRALALDALEILTGPQAGLLRKCAHPACRLLFVARNRRRRWCSGAICGNRARVARHDVIGRRAP